MHISEFRHHHSLELNQAFQRPGDPVATSCLGETFELDSLRLHRAAAHIGYEPPQ